MTNDATAQRALPDPAQVMGALIGPGAPFELVEEDVLGTRLPVFRNRYRALHEVLAASVAEGDRDYLVTADSRLSFGDHAQQVSSLAQALREEHGIEPGDRVAIAAANSLEWVVTFWATVSIGAIAVGFNAWWSPREAEYAVGHCSPALLVADAKRAKALVGTGVPILSIEEGVPALARKHPDAALPTADVAEDDPAAIVYSSGTSGRPKGAVHTHRNLCSVIEYHQLNGALAQRFGDPVSARDRRHLLALPLFHIAGLHNLVVARLGDHGAIVMHQGAFEVDAVLRLIERERVTNWGAVPTMAHRLVEHGDLSGYDLSSLTAFALASAPSSPAFKERLRSAFPIANQALVDSYGLTETCTAVTVATPMDLAQNPGTLGRPVLGVQVEIRDLEGNAVPDGVEGEVCARSAYNMLGYWDDPAATANTIRDDRWLHTGDIGIMENGLLRLSSRRSDLIIRGGENIYPLEIENVLAEHPNVRECIVLGSPHPDLGQEVKAVVVTDPDQPVSEDDLVAYAKEQLAYFKVPSGWRITSEPLPRNATGKVIRAQVTT